MMGKSTFYGLATLFAVLLWGYAIFLQRPRPYHPPLSRVELDFVSIGSALKGYAVNNGQMPTTEQGLDALVTKPVIEPTPRRWNQMMTRVPVDPWQTPYRYELLSAQEALGRSELRCAGPDKVFGTGDDEAEEFEWERFLIQQKKTEKVDAPRSN